MDIEDLPESKIKQLLNMPIIETKLSKSKDGKYVIHKTIITDIRAAEYYGKMINGQESEN
ncbi:MAG: hypothetical protein QXS41_00390 [Candidatus Woesearchaeota archaeon]